MISFSVVPMDLFLEVHLWILPWKIYNFENLHTMKFFGRRNSAHNLVGTRSCIETVFDFLKQKNNQAHDGIWGVKWTEIWTLINLLMEFSLTKRLNKIHRKQIFASSPTAVIDRIFDTFLLFFTEIQWIAWFYKKWLKTVPNSKEIRMF